MIPVAHPLDSLGGDEFTADRRPVRTTDVVERPSDLTAEWLTSAIGTPIAGFTYERIGTGQMSECYRVELAARWQRHRAGIGGSQGGGE